MTTVATKHQRKRTIFVSAELQAGLAIRLK
jgi:hypothetical protein